MRCCGLRQLCLSAVGQDVPWWSSWTTRSTAELNADSDAVFLGQEGRLHGDGAGPRERPDAAGPGGFWWSCWLARWHWVTWRCLVPRAGWDRTPQQGYCWSSYSLRCWLIPTQRQVTDGNRLTHKDDTVDVANMLLICQVFVMEQNEPKTNHFRIK